MSAQDVINYEFYAIQYTHFKAQTSVRDPGVAAILFQMATTCRELYEALTPDERALVPGVGEL